jgi:glycosyltransferase involved in cell wall biosynthesis
MTKKIMVVCNAVVGSKMASPGIRNFHMARLLQQELPDARVTLSLPPKLPSDLDPDSVAFNVVWPSQRELLSLVAEQDIIITSKFPIKMLPVAYDKKIVLDLYTPFFTEWMEMSKGDPSQRHRRAWLEPKRKNLIVQMAVSDLILCANERQRDLIIGIMATTGLISPHAYDTDPSLERLIKLAPLGIRDHDPVRRKNILKGVHPGVRETDTVLLWNGAIVEWYDLDLLVRAVHKLSLERDDIKLFFMGTEHPDSFGAKPLQGLGAGATKAAMELARTQGILDKNVFFNFGWATNEETEQYLLEADMAVCTYFENMETRYSFRTRYVDLFWAELPFVCTRGDVVSEMVDKRTLGVAVPQGDLDALVNAIRKLADDREFRDRCKANLHELRNEFTWERTLAPLVDFCRNPQARLIRRRERAIPIAVKSADWICSQTYYNLRYAVPAKFREVMRKRRGEL